MRFGCRQGLAVHAGVARLAVANNNIIKRVGLAARCVPPERAAHQRHLLASAFPRERALYIIEPRPGDFGRYVVYRLAPCAVFGGILAGECAESLKPLANRRTPIGGRRVGALLRFPKVGKFGKRYALDRNARAGVICFGGEFGGVFLSFLAPPLKRLLRRLA